MLSEFIVGVALDTSVVVLGLTLVPEIRSMVGEVSDGEEITGDVIVSPDLSVPSAACETSRKSIKSTTCVTVQTPSITAPEECS